MRHRHQGLSNGKIRCRVEFGSETEEAIAGSFVSITGGLFGAVIGFAFGGFVGSLMSLDQVYDLNNLDMNERIEIINSILSE